MRVLLLLPVLLWAAPSAAQSPIPAAIESTIRGVEAQVVAWRRDIHQHPELGNREYRTMRLVADHLRSLGIEVRDSVAHTGVVGVLKGGRPGPVVALRADMDALPVTERNDLPFRSRVTSVYNGQEVGVMHACGHDSHVAILLGTATVLARHRDRIPGTVVFLFQPAEEGAPAGEEGGAELMVKEGVMRDHGVDMVFGLHIDSQLPAGSITYRSGGIMASADDLRIIVRGKQAHGAAPWDSVDPILAASHIVTSLQSIVSRNMRIDQNASVVTIGRIQGGVRFNIIPEEVVMDGTVRALSVEDRARLHERIRAVATSTAAAFGAEAEVLLPYSTAYPVTYNQPALMAKTAPVLQQVAGPGKAWERTPELGAEDFSFFAQEAPGVYFFLGGQNPSLPEGAGPSHHTPEFVLDESGFLLGVRAFTALVLESPSFR